MKYTAYVIHQEFRNYGKIKIHAGLRVSPIKEGAYAGRFFLDEFPTETFPKNSMILHDAIHYGVVIEPFNVV